MNPFTKTLSILFAVAVGTITALIGFRELKLPDKKLTFSQKIKRSLTSGFMFSISIFALISALPISFGNVSSLYLDINTIFLFFSCIFISCLIVVTVGMFIQISYLEFLISSGKKD